MHRWALSRWASSTSTASRKRCAARGDDEDLDAFLDGTASEQARKEPFFVKNLERVQGDERDVIILTIGYGKTADGRMLYRFGPINNEGGERRLNVAITRARTHMTVVSSFAAADMDPGRLRSAGAQMLSRYLTYAESGGSNLGDTARDKPDLNPFERDVESRLSAAGIPLIAQCGCSGYWIDFAAQHPTRPGPHGARDRMRRGHLPLVRHRPGSRPSPPGAPRTPRLDIPSPVEPGLVLPPRSRDHAGARRLPRGGDGRRSQRQHQSPREPTTGHTGSHAGPQSPAGQPAGLAAALSRRTGAASTNIPAGSWQPSCAGSSPTPCCARRKNC